MKFPNKLNPYKDTVLYQMVLVLKALSRPTGVSPLYKKVSMEMTLEDFLDAVTCLYATNKIEMNEKGELTRC